MEEALDSKALFKCQREALGLSQAWLAEDFGVSERSVQRWENLATDHTAPQAAFDYLDRLQERFTATVTEAMAKVDELVGATDGTLDHVDLYYYPSQARFEELKPADGGYYGMANAIVREVRHRLEEKGIRTVVHYA